MNSMKKYRGTKSRKKDKTKELESEYNSESIITGCSNSCYPFSSTQGEDVLKCQEILCTPITFNDQEEPPNGLKTANKHENDHSDQCSSFQGKKELSKCIPIDRSIQGEDDLKCQSSESKAFKNTKKLQKKKLQSCEEKDFNPHFTYYIHGLHKSYNTSKKIWNKRITSNDQDGTTDRPETASKHESNYAKARKDSEFIPPKSSVVGLLKQGLPSQCCDGVQCLRHFEMVGFIGKTSYKKKQCSSFQVEKAHSEWIPIDINGAHVKGKTDGGLTHPAHEHKAEKRGAYLVPDRHTSDVVKTSGPVVDITPECHISKTDYDCDAYLIESVTKWLHVPRFDMIVEKVDPIIEKLQHSSRKLVPLLFVSGLSHFKLVKYDEAKSKFFQCDKICLDLGKIGDSALCHLYLGDIHFLSHQYHEASSHYQSTTSRYSKNTVASLFRMVPPSLSTVYAKHASALRNSSKMIDAVQKYKQAIAEAQTKKELLAANTSLGNLYQSLGENKSALTHYEQSIMLSEELHDYVSLGWAHGNIGNAYLGIFQKDKALSHLLTSLKLTLQNEPTPQAIGRAYNNLGTAYQSLGDLVKAQEYYEQALSQAIYGGDKAGQARVSGNMGNILMLRKKYEAAVPQYTEVLSFSKDKSTLSTAHHNRGCAYYEWGEAQIKAPENQPSNLTVAVIGDQEKEKSATFYIHSSDSKESKFSPLKVPDVASQYYKLGYEDLSKVVKFHENHLDSIKGSSKGLTLSVSLFETNSRTFHRLQDCLVCCGDYIQALLVAEQSRSRTLGELMLARNGWHLQNPLSSPMPFDQILATMESIEHPVLYLSYTGARLLGWVFLSHQDGIKLDMFEVPMSDDQFDGKSFDYHLRFELTEVLVERNFEMYREVGDYDESTSAPVQTLYHLIAEPLLAILLKHGATGTNKLVIISDSYTALLPYSSLHNLKSNSFLGDYFSIQLMPSFLTMSVLNQLPDANVVNLPVDDQCMCIVGNPNIPQFKYNEEVWNLGKLPHAQREAESVAHIMKTSPILDSQATKRIVLMRMMNAKIIHLATHGSASAGFLAFGAFCALGEFKAIDAQGVLLYPEEVENLKISPALVVLSSCDSGRGTVKADGIQGMARAFILAGAQAVLTTLWRVPDESAAIFMQFFYQYMMDGLESTKALQKAILSIRCFSKYSQYIHWSGYQLTGRDVFLKYTSSNLTHILERQLGLSNTFPRLQEIKNLEAGLVNVNCYPSDVQILEGSSGLDAHELVIDFIHSSCKHFSKGIFWINCERVEHINSALNYIEKCIQGPLESIELSELQQCLVILDGIKNLPNSESLLKLLTNRYAHCIMIYQHLLPTDDLIHAVDHKLLRGCKVHSLEPLSMILSTQRIVYTMQERAHFCPKTTDQSIIQELSDFCCGSPVLVYIVSQLLLSYLNNSSEDKPQKALVNFANDISTLNCPQDSDLNSLPTPTLTALNSDTCVAGIERNLSDHLTDKLSSICKMGPDYRDEWDTQCKYDSWDSAAALLNAGKFEHETKLLLDCLTVLGGNNVPIKIAISLSTFITEASGRTHFANSLLDQLMDKGFVKLYPSPVVVYELTEFPTEICIHIPKFVNDFLSKHLEVFDMLMAFTICLQTFSKFNMPKSAFIDGLFLSFIEVFELNYDYMDLNCYKCIFKYYLSLK